MKSKKSKSSILKILIGLAVGIAFGYGMGALLGGKANLFSDKPSIWAILLAIPISFYLTIIIHELGHVLGGLIMGNDFMFMTAGPFKLSKEEGSLQFSLNKHINLSGGLAMTLPTKVEGFKLRRFVVIFGGPFFSLLSSICCLCIYFFAWPHLSGNIQVFVILFGLISLLIFIITIIPQNINGMMTDGYQLLMILKDDDKAKKYADMLHLTALNQQGKSPSEYPQLILDKYADSPIENPMDLAFKQFEYYRDLAEGNIVKAGEKIKVIESNAGIYPPAFYPDVLAEPYFYYSFIEPNETKIKEIRELMKDSVPRASQITANMYRGARSFNDKNFDKAREYLETVLSSKKADGFTLLFKQLISSYAFDKMNHD